MFFYSEELTFPRCSGLLLFVLYYVRVYYSYVRILQNLEFGALDEALRYFNFLDDLWFFFLTLTYLVILFIYKLVLWVSSFERIKILRVPLIFNQL